MFCPACGAENKDRDQRYCRECGATLPARDSGSTALVKRPAGTKLPLRGADAEGRQVSLLNTGMKNKLILGAIGVVVLIVALNIVIHLIIATVTAILLPLTVLAAIGLVGYFYLRGMGRR